MRAGGAEFHRLFAAWDSSGSTHIGTWYTGPIPKPEILPLEAEPGAA